MFNHTITEHGHLIVSPQTTTELFGQNLNATLANFQTCTDVNFRYHACYPCTKIFDSIRDFLIHAEYIHEHETTKNHCSQCGIDNETTDIQHIYKVHPELVYCPFVNCTLYKTGTKLKDHLFQQHQLTIQNYHPFFFNTGSYLDIIRHILNRPNRLALNDRTPTKFMDKQTPLTSAELRRQMRAQLSHLPPECPTKELDTSSTAMDIVRTLSLHVPSLHDRTKDALRHHLSTRYHVNKELTEYSLCDGTYHLLGGEQADTIDNLDPSNYNKNAFPILLYGNNILDNMIILQEDYQISLNLCNRKTRFWPTYIDPENFQSYIEHVAVRQTHIPKDYFTYLDNQLYGVTNYPGILIVEADIQPLLPTANSNDFVERLALAFVHGLTRLVNKPKIIIVIGAISSNMYNHDEIEEKIAQFNAYLTVLCWNAKIIFKNPSERSHKYQKDGNVWHYYISEKAVPKLFTGGNKKSQDGYNTYQSWLTDIYLEIQKIAVDIETPLQNIVL